MVYDFFNNVIVEFISNLERKYMNFESYFRGFISNKFIDFHRFAMTNGNKIFKNSISIESNIEGTTLQVSDVLASSEDIRDWYSKKEIYDIFLNNDSEVLNSGEKQVLLMRLDDKSFKEISSELKLSYKIVISIYNLAIQKLKKKLNK